MNNQLVSVPLFMCINELLSLAQSSKRINTTVLKTLLQKWI